MNNLKDFVIPFRGLSIGVHDYNWEIDNKFFEIIENSEIGDSKLTVELKFEKQERMLVLNFFIKGNVLVQCDRCLDDLELQIDSSEVLFIKFGPEKKEESADVLIIPESEYQIDVSWFINEYITLSLPLKKVHPTDKNGNSLCNKEVLRKIDELKLKKKIDPRWENLKNLKFDY